LLIVLGRFGIIRNRPKCKCCKHSSGIDGE
jgi:hypothetical protein